MKQIDIAHDQKLKGKQKMTEIEVIKNDIKLLEFEKRKVIDRNNWRRMINILDLI